MAMVYMISSFANYQSLYVVGKLYSYSNAMHESIRGYYEQFFRSKDLIAENLRLRKKLLVLEAKINSYSELVSENSDLRELLGSSSKLSGSFISGKVIGWAGQKHIAIINLGAKDMVFVGQAVLDAHGVLGQVVEVAKETSKVSLVTSPGTSVPVRSKNSIKGFAHGIGEGSEITNVITGSKISLGEKIYSSGVGKVYPMGYPYGVVAGISDNKNGNKTVRLSLAADLGHMDTVLLYWAERPIKPPYRAWYD